MPRLTLSIDTIGEVDSGALAIAVNKALKLVSQDLHDRPALAKARRLMLTLDMKPVLDKNSSSPQLESVEFAWQVNTKSPAIGSDSTVMKPQQDGQLYFHSDLPDSPSDESIMDEAERRKEEVRRRDRQGKAGETAGS